MSRRVATREAVFQACERLEREKKAWNRDDVRHLVGGGGFAVIDPLIQAWRQLEEVRSTATAIPTTMLHDVAVAIEDIVSRYETKRQAKITEIQKAFDETAARYKEELNQLRSSHATLLNNQETLKSTNEKLQDALDGKSREADERRAELLALQAETDQIRGALEFQKESYLSLQSSAERKLALAAKDCEEKLERQAAAHVDAMKRKEQSLTTQHEASENRWLTLLDSERREAKVAQERLRSEVKATQDEERQMSRRLEESQRQIARLNEENRSLKDAESSSKHLIQKLEKQRDELDQQKNEALQQANSAVVRELQEAISSLNDKFDQRSPDKSRPRRQPGERSAKGAKK